MGTKRHAMACVALAATGALSACAAHGPAGPRPALRFTVQDAAPASDRTPVRVYRAGDGRPVYFREQRLDHHGVMRDVAPDAARPERRVPPRDDAQDDCDARSGCRQDDIH